MFENAYSYMFNLLDLILQFGENIVYFFGTRLSVLAAEAPEGIASLLNVVINVFGVGNFNILELILTVGLTFWVAYSLGRFFLPFI